MNPDVELIRRHSWICGMDSSEGSHKSPQPLLVVERDKTCEEVGADLVYYVINMMIELYTLDSSHLLSLPFYICVASTLK